MKLLQSLSLTIVLAISLIACSSAEPKGGKTGPADSPAAQGNEVDTESMPGNENADNKKNSETINPGNTGSGNNSDDLLAGVELATETKVRNYRELFLTFSQLTGIDPFTDVVLSEFETRIQGSLPTQNVASEYTTTHQVGNFKLAALFCREALRQPESQEIVFGNLENVDKESELSAATLNPIAEKLMQSLWRQSSADPQDKQDLVAMGLSLVDDIKQVSANASNEQVFDSVAIASCTGVLTSAKVFLY